MRNRVVFGAVLMVIGSGCASKARQATLADGFAALERGDMRAALEIYDSVARQHPDTMEGALAIDHAIEVSGQRLFPRPSYECSPDAVAKYMDADRQFVAGAMDAALAAYQQATELCPKNASWWIHSGDCFFHTGQYEHAKALYLQGLRLDPWNRSGYRFLADAESRLGDPAQAYQNAILAVVSDPTYEAGWQFLKELTQGLGGRWNRRHAAKPPIEKVNGQLKLVLSPEYESQGSFAAWLAYGTLRFRLTEGAQEGNADGEASPTNLPSPEEWKRLSPLDRERFLVSKVLDMYGKLTSEKPEYADVFWETFEKAARAGFLDEAIYLHLMDRDLAPPYATYRAEHTARLIDYVTKIIAPLPPSGSRKV